MVPVPHDAQHAEQVREVLALQLAALNGDVAGLTLLLAEADLTRLRRWCAYLALTQAAMARDALPGYRASLQQVALRTC